MVLSRDSLIQIIATLVMLAALFVLAPVVQAEVIQSYNTDIQIQEDSSLQITETIEYDFEDARRHGIFRQIPVSYQTDTGNRRIFLSNISVRQDGAAAQWETSNQDGNLKIKIGDPDKEITGEHTYEIIYEAKGTLNFFDDGRAELYWDVVGDSWEVPVNRTEAQLHLPAEVKEAEVEYRCFVGKVGSDSTCPAVDFSAGSLLVSNDPRVAFYPGEAMTVVLNFPAEIVEKPSVLASVWWWFQANPIVLLPLLTLLVSFFAWWRWGRDPKGRGVVVTQYEPPEDLKPILVGALVDDTVHTRDITAGILYLAQQGFIEIEQEEKSWFLGSHDYVLTRVRPLEEITDSTYRTLAEEMFSAHTLSGSINISDIFSASKSASDPKESIHLSELKKSKGFQKVIRKMKKDVMADMRDRGWFTERNNVIGWVFSAAIFAGFLLLQLAGGSLGIVSIVSIGATVGILTLFSALMKRKTKEGAILQEKLLGFREFLAMTQKERLDFHNAPERNPQEFMEYLPYAVALEVEEKWAKQFKGLDMPPPRWYRSSGAFVAADFAGDLASFSESYSQAAGGSSGTSGGVAGGGMGGGGGGSW